MNSNQYKILVVDDLPLNLKIVCSLLKKIDIATCTASNGEEAIKLFQSNDFDAIFMDVSMPILDGVSALKHIRHNEGSKGKNIPVFMVTAHSSEEDLNVYLSYGATGLIPKPIHLDAVIYELNKTFILPEKLQSKLA